MMSFQTDDEERNSKTEWQSFRSNTQTQRLVYNFLRNPQKWPAILYHVMIICLVLSAMFCYGLTTVPPPTGFNHKAGLILVFLDHFIATIGCIELFILIWARSGWPKHQNLKRFLISKSFLFDLIILMGAIALVFCHHRHLNDCQPGLVFVLRFGQWAQILRLGYRFKSCQIMASVIWQQRYQFLITFYMCFVWLIFVTMVMFAVEQEPSPNGSEFTSLPKTFWWSVVSLFTIGYGDMTPSTHTGKILASIFFFLFIFKFALPAGVLSTGLALKIQDQHRLKHISQRRTAAARLIQWAWRYNHHCNTFPAVFRRRDRFVSHDSGTVIVDDDNDRSARSASKSGGPEYHCIRFILNVRFIRARRQFRRALRPYDFADVMEQYEMGHQEILGQLTHLDRRVADSEIVLIQSQRTLEAILKRLEERKIFLDHIENRLHHESPL